jgi:quinohemoprotein amine dehydrogenase
MKRGSLRFLGPVPALASAFLFAALPVDAAQAQDSETHPDGGYAIDNETLIDRCTRCHKQNDEGRMSRISYLRKTPEGWQTSIRRMVTLNEIRLSPEEAREIVKYLSDHQGLAPEELRPALFEVERRLVDFTYEADADVEHTCISCHSIGRAMTQRRSPEEWELLMATHRGYYPLVDFQAFRRLGPAPTEPGPDGSPPDTRHPMEKAVDHFSAAYPLETPEWSAWSATMRSPRLEGTWTVAGHQAGVGPVFGTMEVTASNAGPDRFQTRTTLHFAAQDRSVERTGEATVYTGYQWRGRSSVGGDAQALREVMVVERDWQEMSGRWFTGAYDEIGVDVTVRRANGSVLAGVEPTAVRSGASGQSVTLYGAGFTEGLGPADFDFGPGVEVAGVSRAAPDRVTLELDVTADAAPGRRDLFVGNASLGGALAVFDRVDRIAVAPAWGMARVGGANFPRQYQQFEAVAFHDGPDGEPETEDDVPLGVVDATWHLEEYAATYGDDDVGFVGDIDDTGLFTPALDGPNPERQGRRNNVGDVWAVATFRTHDGRDLGARAHLLVTVPLYVRFDPSDMTGDMVRSGAMTR